MDKDDLPPSICFPEEELKIIELHKRLDAFKTSCKLSRSRPSFTFYDGPPFATGLPHYGHLLAGTIKDIVTRFAYSRGYHVERHFGWDCHGLPVEYEVDKTNNIKGPQDVEKMGIAAYNNKCREIVMRYSEQWKIIVERIGRWIDFEEDYRTMYPTFMESVWWVFKQIFTKGLVYRGIKVMPYSTACATALSNFEAGQNYKDVQDPAIVVSFPFDNESGVELLAWTTTPWTLPSNLALCVHPDKCYVKLEDKTRNKVFVMMESRVSSLYKKATDYIILKKIKGRDLVGLSYKPIFDYYIELKQLRGAFRVVGDAYVTEETGTGIVHQAPYFGEDDFRICLREGIVSKDMPPVCPVDASGCFTHEVTDFADQFVKDADKAIIQHIKKTDRLISHSTIQHSYPFCWRSDTPLLYKAVPTWFVRVEDLVGRLLSNNAKSTWVPDFIQEKRFANWLSGARDWAISRNRYWGTPIPLWVSSDMEEVICVGSISELERLSGKKITDLHKEFVDPITIPSRMGKGDLHRISEVFDCWFESGSMPYAQLHYPFENTQRFMDGFPADFIAEGVDQTRGWFYTLLVLSTALFDKPPFKNLVVSGIVLAADGQKMSKRLKNYPDPQEVIRKHGADSLRLYLINSPVVRAQNLRFSESGVRDVLKDVFIPWYNAFRFLMKSSLMPYERAYDCKFVARPGDFPRTDNYMDKWVLSFTQSLLAFVNGELKAYRLYTVVPRLVKFIDHLVNWYIRMNRRRLKGDAVADRSDWLSALGTLVKVIFQLICVMAPFAPFFTEYIYQRLRTKLDFSDNLKEPGQLGVDQSTGAPLSLHYITCLEPHVDQIHEDIEETVAWMQAVVELGRSIRTKKDLPLKAPLREAVVVHGEEAVRRKILSMKTCIVEELNVRTLTVTGDREKYGIKLRARLNPAVGARFKSQVKVVMEAVRSLTEERLETYIRTNELAVGDGMTLSGDDLTVDYVVVNPNQENAQGCGTPSSAEAPQFETQADLQRGLLILLDVRPDAQLEEERLAREIINRIQRIRKKGNLMPEESIQVVISTESEVIPRLLLSHAALIDATVKQPITCNRDAALAEESAQVAALSQGEQLGAHVVSEEASIPPHSLLVSIFHSIGAKGESTTAASVNAATMLEANKATASSRNLSVLCSASLGAGGPIIVTLVDSTGQPLVGSVVQLMQLVRGVLGWGRGASLRFWKKKMDKKTEELTCNSTDNVLDLGDHIYVE